MPTLALISCSRARRPRADNTTRPPPGFFALIHRCRNRAFQLARSILRDDAAAERITRQVFARVHRRLACGDDHDSATVWIHHASLRFARRYYWRSATPRMRRWIEEAGKFHPGHFSPSGFARILAFQPGRIDPHDCDLILLRHVLGLPPAQISRVLRMHPYEISNRLAWSLERLKTGNPSGVACVGAG